MRFPLKLTALLMLFFLAFSFVGGTGVGAQDDLEDDFQPEDLEGIEYAIARSWTVDFESMFEMTTPESADELEMPTGLLFMASLVMEFDNEGNAETGFGQVTDEFSVEDLMMDDGATVDEWDIELGNQSVSYFSIEELDGVDNELVVSIVQDGNYIYIVTAAGSDMDMQASTTSLMETMIDNDGSGEGDFNEDGASSGGLWDKFPTSDDDAFAGLIAIDEIVYPETDDDDN